MKIPERVMKEKSLSFSDPMVRALLEGKKTQTRRVLKATVPDRPAMDNIVHPPKHDAPYLDAYCGGPITALNPRGMTNNWAWWTRDDRPGKLFDVKYQPGDRLWVKESFVGSSKNWGYNGSAAVFYKADQAKRIIHISKDQWDSYSHKRESPRFMPRWASRITLEVTGVRVERVWDISEDDAKAEGFAKISKDHGRTWKYGIPDRDGEPGTDDSGWEWQEWNIFPRSAFKTLWDSLYAKKPERQWAANPWVVVIEFERKK